MNTMFETPKCDSCTIKFNNIAALDVHMKVVCQESDHSRIDRRMEMAKDAINNKEEKSVTKENIEIIDEVKEPVE